MEVPGRAEQLAEIDERLLYMTQLQRLVDRIRVDHGPRGMGKTSLLRHVQAMAQDRGVATVWVTAGGSDSLVMDLFEEFRRLGTQWSDSGRQGRLERLLDGVEVTVTAGVPGVASVEAKRTRPAGVGAPRPGRGTRALKTVLTAGVQEALEVGRSGLVVFIDEVQDADRAGLRVLAHAWQELQVEAQSMPMAVFAAGLPQSPVTINRAVTFTERFEYWPLGPLAPDAARFALVGPARRVGVRWSADALERAVQQSRGNPFLVQLFGDAVWAAAGRPDPGAELTAAHVAAGLERADVSLAGLFRARWERASPKEQQVMAAIAGLGDEPVARADVEGVTGINRAEFSTYRARLIDKGLLEAPAHGQLQFTIPGFSGWIRRQDDDVTITAGAGSTSPSREQLLQQIHALQQQLAAAEPPNQTEPGTGATNGDPAHE